jgi:hypothetical protein
MLIRTLLFIFSWSLITAAPVIRAADDTTAVDELRQAITTARRQVDSPFSLDVRCTNEQARRSLQVFSSGVGVWNRSVQISLPWSTRGNLLGLLLTHDFPAFAPRYGDQAVAGKMDGPMRVSCEINFAINGLQKTSVQLYDGPQSSNFLSLANALLDESEPLAQHGVSSKDLRESLDKLASGVLAPQVFSLRYVETPSPGNTKDGMIIRIGDAQLTRQAYTPGRVMGKPSSQQLPADRFQILVQTLRSADFSNLPLNLYAEDQIELEVKVLGQRKTIIARPFSRLEKERTSVAQQHFDGLAELLRTLNTG